MHSLIDRRILVVISLFFLNSCVTPSSSTETSHVKEIDECNEIIEILKTKKALKKEGQNCIVLCDFSSTVDAASIGFVKERAAEIFDKFYCKSFIQFYSITNASTGPFFQSEEVVIADSNKITRAQNVRLRKCISMKLADKRSELVSALENAVKSRPRATYIIQSLENAMSVISIRDPDQRKRNLIFLLSDMKESGKSLLGSFNLDLNGYDSEISKLKASPGHKLSPAVLQSVEIRIGFYSANPKDKHKLVQFWDLVFQKLGFSGCPPISSQVNTAP